MIYYQKPEIREYLDEASLVLGHMNVMIDGIDTSIAILSYEDSLAWTEGTPDVIEPGTSVESQYLHPLSELPVNIQAEIIKYWRGDAYAE